MTHVSPRALLPQLALLLALTSCVSAPSDIGGSCTEVGHTSGCVDGAVCTNASTGATCRKICTDQAQCAANENCTGISGTSTKSCQPK